MSEEEPSAGRAREGKTWWKPFLEPAVLTALVTVVVGGLFGGWITHIYQEGAKNRELQQVSYREYLSQEQETMKRAYSLIGSCISSSKRLIYQSARRYYDPQIVQSLNRTDLENLRKQIVNTRHNFNEIYVKWETEQAELALLMDYYHPDQSEVLNAWKKVTASTSAFMECAANWNDAHGNTPGASEEELKRCL